ncbi:TfoX/Sxy family protein [Montanilutibacter psychrotolerans]|uniref:Transcriptional regulator n=1 Tax=Montanilutibacter psychrotolerans TaxID=1327343 RepID=A0A3M8STN3_9GAMM|nr:TfoX/Sxy family protein [Lysobacter psychrotolerans]RNF82230.1 transcriptional regulator [Lysobacter psychrotolerans]
MTTVKLRNIGPKSAAWLRQVGLRSHEDLAAIGTVEAFMRVKRAGFKPTLNLLYAIEGALLDCHWQEIPDERRAELISAAEAAIALLPPPRYRPAASPCTTTMIASEPTNIAGLHDSDGAGLDFDTGIEDGNESGSGDDRN